MRSLPILVLLVASWLALAACQERGFAPVEEVVAPIGVVTIATSARPAPVDLLFVIDNSATMCGTQQALAEAASSLVGGLVRGGADVRVAVTTTDMADPLVGDGKLRTAPGVPGCPQAALEALPCPALPAARPWLESGAQAAPGGAVGDDALQREDLIARLSAQLGCLMRVGPGGSPFEMGLGAALAALERRPDFVRDEAQLAVVFVSDENDCSDGTRGTRWGAVYSEAMRVPDDRVCELWRNLEDSCPWTAGAPGPLLTHEGRTQSAFDWCVEGEREALEALVEGIAPRCPDGGCANMLTSRRALLDGLAAFKAPSQLFVAALVHPDDGRRDDASAQALHTCGEGRVGYRYELFARMLPPEQRLVAPVCEPEALDATLGALAQRLLRPLEHVCLAAPALFCTADGPAAPGQSCAPGERCCPHGERCESVSGGQRQCSGFALSASLESGDGGALRALVADVDYALEVGSRRCRDAQLEFSVELRLREPLPAGARLVIEYPGRLALD